MNKNECEDLYSESETEEHINGKRDLYEWIKRQNGVTNAVLEGWMPETKQRPDIMFEYNGQKYVIEYQCTPIATEYVERHELYKASGIIDIWILGTEKYLKSNMREKYIGNYAFGFYSYEYNSLFPIKDNVLYRRCNLITKTFKSYECFSGLPLNTFTFEGSIYNFKFGKLADVRKKIDFRMKNRSIIEKNKNLYLGKQKDKLLFGLYDILENLFPENNNWSKYPWGNSSFAYSYHSGVLQITKAYGIRMDCLPEELYKKIKNKNLIYIKFKKINYEVFRQCVADNDYLKCFIFQRIVAIKKELLEYDNDKIRFMEVRE